MLVITSRSYNIEIHHGQTKEHPINWIPKIGEGKNFNFSKEKASSLEATPVRNYDRPNDSKGWSVRVQ